MGIRELRKLASDLKVKNYSKMKKPELEAAVAAAQNQTLPVKGDSANVPNDMNTLAKRLGAGSVEDTSSYLSLLDKGDARKVRKALRNAGFPQHAAAPRLVRQVRAAA